MDDDRTCREKHRALKDSFEREASLLTKAFEVRLDAMDKAIVLKTEELRQHLHTLNGHQAELKNDRNNFVGKNEYAIETKALTKRIDDLSLELRKYIKSNDEILIPLRMDFSDRIGRTQWISIAAILISIIAAALRIIIK
jgi:hypothetical protein